MARLVSELDDYSVYYYDERKTCRVKLPDIDIHAILNAEVFNFQGQKHCDVIFLCVQDEVTKVYLVELKDITTSNEQEIASVISPETVSEKAKGSLDLIQQKVFKLYPYLKINSKNLEIEFILIVGGSAMEAIWDVESLSKRIKSRFSYLTKYGLTKGRIKACGSDVYHDTLSFELL
jgi:2,3-bisphosphoglycerate-independent phosphoglycerate mutase